MINNGGLLVLADGDGDLEMDDLLGLLDPERSERALASEGPCISTWIEGELGASATVVAERAGMASAADAAAMAARASTLSPAAASAAGDAGALGSTTFC